MPDESITSPYEKVLISRLQYQGNSNDCGPYSLATIIYALTGLEINPYYLAREMDRPVWRGPRLILRRIPHWATFPWGMTDILNRYGLQASWRMFTKIEDLWTYLANGCVLMPFLGNWKPLWAHVMTLVKWDPDMGWGFANTQFSTHKIFWLQEADFKYHWQALFRTLVKVRCP